MINTERRASSCVEQRAQTDTDMALEEKELEVDCSNKNFSLEDKVGDICSSFEPPVCMSSNGCLILERDCAGNVKDVSECRSHNGHLNNKSVNINKIDYVELHPRQSQSSEGKHTLQMVNFKLSRKTFRRRVLAKYEENRRNGDVPNQSYISPTKPNTSPFACTHW